MVQGWKVGDKLEALDIHDTEHDLAYVATVSNVMEVNRLYSYSIVTIVSCNLFVRVGS